MTEELLPVKNSILDYLAKNGGKASGGQVKTDLGLEDDVFKPAKVELKDEGKITTGRGRGGTLSLVDESQVVEAERQEDIKQRRISGMRAAREEKKLKRSESKQNRERIDEALAAAQEKFPDHECEFHAINISRNVIFVCVWGLDGDNQRARVLEF